MITISLTVKEDGDLVWRDSNFLAKNWLEILKLHRRKHNNISDVDFPFPIEEDDQNRDLTLVIIFFPTRQSQPWRMLHFFIMLEASISFSMGSSPPKWCARSILKKKSIPFFFSLLPCNCSDLLQYVDYQDPSHTWWPLTIIAW